MSSSQKPSSHIGNTTKDSNVPPRWGGRLRYAKTDFDLEINPFERSFATTPRYRRNSDPSIRVQPTNIKPPTHKRDDYDLEPNPFEQSFFATLPSHSALPPLRLPRDDSLGSDGSSSQSDDQEHSRGASSFPNKRNHLTSPAFLSPADYNNDHWPSRSFSPPPVLLTALQGNSDTLRNSTLRRGITPSGLLLGPKLYDNLFRLVVNGPSRQKATNINNLASIVKEADRINSLGSVERLVHSRSYRALLLRALSEQSIVNDTLVREAIREDEENICNIFKGIVNSPEDRKHILSLEDDDAQAMLNLIQFLLDKGLVSYSNNGDLARQAHRLLVRLSEACDILPSSLSISGIILLETHAAFGGGFADIFRGMHQGGYVAIKRMRVFQRDEERHRVHRMITREALIWQRLKHPYVLPFLGIDSETFPPFFCLISPWMSHGTILRHIAENGRLGIEQRTLEIAEGLEYLHTQGVVHGDLRGANILIDSEWHVRLADFGLTVLADSTLATHTSHASGATRWMAPELLSPEALGFSQFRRTKASDVYAFGCTCLEIYTQAPPFSDLPHEPAVLFRVIVGARPKQPQQEVLPASVWNIIESSWQQNPGDRPTSAEVLSQLKALQ